MKLGYRNAKALAGGVDAWKKAGYPMGKTSESNVAIKGYDAVAYFRAGRAVKGSETFAVTWHKMTWHFSTEENRDLFAASPEKYAPQYDGYCAWAMAEGRKALTDPEIWDIVDGRFYLHCSQAAREKWSRDIRGNVEKADKLWLTLAKSEEP